MIARPNYSPHSSSPNLGTSVIYVTIDGDTAGQVRVEATFRSGTHLAAHGKRRSVRTSRYNVVLGVVIWVSRGSTVHGINGRTSCIVGTSNV